ncbi:unknown [Prevotella sp. CAG:1124]|nr:unknown [Prevotella sp. CAG:1124]
MLSCLFSVRPLSGQKLWRFTPRMFTFFPLMYRPSPSRVSMVRKPNLSRSMCSVLPLPSMSANSTWYLLGVSAVHSLGLETLKVTSAWSLPWRTAVVFSATFLPLMSLIVVRTFAPSSVWLSRTKALNEPSAFASIAVRSMFMAGLQTINTGRNMPPKFQ